MPMTDFILYIVTGVLVTLLVGLFFGYSVSVNGAFKRLNDYEYVKAMQAINIVILNPVFLLSFMGPIILLPIITFMARANATEFWLLVGATTFYVVGTVGITIVGNVPLNDRLAKVDLTDLADVRDARHAFAGPWNRLHTLRTISGIAASILLFWAYLI